MKPTALANSADKKFYKALDHLRISLGVPVICVRHIALYAIKLHVGPVFSKFTQLEDCRLLGCYALRPLLKEPHGLIFQKTTSLIVAAMKTSNLT
jgi:hypothetical protein